MCGATTLDVMPTVDDVLGFSNPWYPHAFATATLHELRGPDDARLEVRVISAATFVATKLSAYASRGGGDPFHHDLEDVVAVVDGRPGLVDEMRSEPRELQSFVADELKKLFDAGLEENAGYHLPSDSASQARLPKVVGRLRGLAQAAPHVGLARS